MVLTFTLLLKIIRYYGQSKLANVLFASELSRRLGDGSQRVYVNSIHPGAVATDLGRHIRDVLATYLPESALGVILRTIYSLLWTSDEAALTQLCVLLLLLCSCCSAKLVVRLLFVAGWNADINKYYLLTIHTTCTHAYSSNTPTQQVRVIDSREEK